MLATSQLSSAKLPMPKGTVFFNTILQHALALRALHSQQVHGIEENMAVLSRHLAQVTTPRRLSGKKSDLDVWRTVLKLFLNAKLLLLGVDPITGAPVSLSPVQRLLDLHSQISKRQLVSGSNGT